MVNSETMPDMNSSVNHKKRGEGKGKKKLIFICINYFNE